MESGVHDEHLQAVLDIRETGVRVKIKRQDLDSGKQLLQPFGDSTSTDMTGHAAKGLEDDDQAHLTRGIVQYFRCYEEAFATAKDVGDDIVTGTGELTEA